MGKIYFIWIYALVIFCVGCVVAEMLTGNVSPFAMTMIAAGMALLIYTIRLMNKPETKPELNRVLER